MLYFHSKLTFFLVMKSNNVRLILALVVTISHAMLKENQVIAQLSNSIDFKDVASSTYFIGLQIDTSVKVLIQQQHVHKVLIQQQHVHKVLIQQQHVYRVSH